MPKTDLGRRFVADYLKIPEVGQLLGLSEKTVRRRVKAGEIPSVFIGGVYRISRADLEEYLELARVRPGKVSASISSQPPLNGFEEERRAPSLHSWTVLVNALADRWEQEIKERETEWLAAKPAVKKYVKRLPNLGWGTEIRRTAAEVWANAARELEAGLDVYTSEEALGLFRALKRLDGVIDRTDDWYSRADEGEPEEATVHDISEGAERKAERKAALERTGKQLGA
jgi:excisionase family DNA binding protein